MTERPAPYVVADRWEWQVCEEEDGPTGFAILVRTTVTNRERDDLVARYQEEIVRYSAVWREMGMEERAAADEAQDTPRDREWKLLAPFVKDWNATGETTDGETVPLPPPAEAGWEVFRGVYPEMSAWAAKVVLNGYRATGKAGGWTEPSGRT